MRHLEQKEFSVETIVKDCASTFRDETLKRKFIDSAEHIEEKSEEYRSIAENNDWLAVSVHDTVNTIITKEEMVKLYDKKFVGNREVREKYYDKILSNAKLGKCPICGVSQASTLDHYLAKTLYPTYAVTPDNLIPVCKDCNKEKGDTAIECEKSAPFHPYFDDIDDYIWLCADVICENDIWVAEYYVNPEINKKDSELYFRLCSHFNLYKLKNAYSIQASAEISENLELWRKIYTQGGAHTLVKHMKECLASYEMVQKNTWKTALLRGLINAVENNVYRIPAMV